MFSDISFPCIACGKSLFHSSTLSSIEWGKVNSRAAGHCRTILSLILVDPVTRGIELTVHFFNLQFDVQFWSQYVSFILIGIIVVTSIRGLLITLTKVGTGWSQLATERSRLFFFSSSTSSPVAGLRTSSFYALLNWWFVGTNASVKARSRLFRACILFRRSSLFAWICQHNTGTSSFAMISIKSFLSLAYLDKSYRSFLVIYNSISIIDGSTASSCFPHSSVLEFSICTIDPPNNHFHSMTRMFKRRLTSSQSKE